MGALGSIGMICTMQKLGVLHLMSPKTLIEKYGSAAEACEALGIDYLSSNPSTASHAVIHPDYHTYTQPRKNNGRKRYTNEVIY
jgi:hypothetical protein